MAKVHIAKAAEGAEFTVRTRLGLSIGASALAAAASLAAAGPAYAQAAPPPSEQPGPVEPGALAQEPEDLQGPAQGAEAGEPGEIVVTGSRIARDGYEAPTPLTVVGEEEIQAAAPANVADFVNDIPSVVGSATPATSNASISSGTAGVNALNLRGIGSNRTLVLLDGQRSVGSTLNGVVDVNTFPQGLIQRVEIVTGGASAAYGSDAVSGVVNFILDKQFSGVKGAVENGITTYGDDYSWRVNLSAGIPFAGGRGRLLLNGEAADREGIYGVPRAWNRNGWYLINNPAYTPTNGAPERFISNNIGLSNATPGGIITNTPLRGTSFWQGGEVRQFNYGITRDPWMIGGDWRIVQVNDRQSLHADERRQGLFGRLSFEFGEALELFAQASWNRHASLGWTGVQFNQGNVVIRSDNAFLPADIRARLAALRITQFNLGTTNADLPIRKTDNERTVERYVIGANGRFGLFGRNARWDAYYQKGITNTEEMARDITNNARLAMAQDAVFHPVTGQIVCRSSIANPSNGCVPFNRMGIGVNSQAALDYILGNPYREQRFTQDVAAANLSFDAFEWWAGTVAVALGAEHRREGVSGEVEEQYRRGWFVGNYLPTFGKYDVTEGYFEAIVPLAPGLEFNGAVRGTEYSTSGFVTTWKAGLTFEPIPDIRFRATRSRDIRAPNLQELFTAGTSRTNTLVDPFNNNTNVQFLEQTTGNPNLLPEIADTWGVGVVVQPRFIPGLAFSVDYYDIKIEDAIGGVQAQTIVDRCFEGAAEYCAAITRGTAPGGAQIITRVSVSPFNFAQQQARGIDVEATYRMALADLVGVDGTLTLRAMGTRFLENYINNGIDPPTDTAGQNFGDGPPDYLYRLQATYRNNDTTINLTGRGISSGTYDNSFIECESGCPKSTIQNRTININRLNGAFYLDASIARSFQVGRTETELFMSVTNLTNEDPEIVPWGPAGTAYGNPSTNQGLYDFLGRMFRVGARFNFK